MKLTKEELKAHLEYGKNEGAVLFWIEVEMEGFPCNEVIVNNYDNMDSKMAYYEKTYDDNLVLRSFSGIKIVNCGYSRSYDLHLEI